MSLQDTLERLQRTPGFYVKQNWEALEQLTSCYEQGNSYEVYNIPDAKYRNKGMEGDVKILHAQEKTGFCKRCCCGENRAFEFNFQTSQSRETFVRMTRGYRCCGWAVIPCCAHQVNVYSSVQVNEENNLEVVGSSGDLNLAGQVRVPCGHGGCCVPKYDLYDEKKEKVGYMWGYSCCLCPCIICDFCGADFGIYKHGKRVGKLEKLGVKNCKDYLLEMHTDADKYTVEFDEAALKEEVDVNFKLSVLAAVLLLDFNYFEDSRGCKEGRCCDLSCCGFAIACCPSLCLDICCICCKKDKNKKKEKTKVVEGGPANKPEEI